MFRDLLLIIISCILTTELNEWRFKGRQKKMLIKEIVENFLKLRKEGEKDHVHELLFLQKSGILLLKEEKDAQDVLRQIELKDKPVKIPGFIKTHGILQGLKKAIDKGIDIGNFREITIEEIGEAIKSQGKTLSKN